MSTNVEIGARAKEALGDHSQAWLCEKIEKSTDTMSRSLNGHRGFSSVEIAKIADALNVDVHWLITGEPDPLRVSIAARHDYDHSTGERSNPGRASDEQELHSVELAYRQAYPNAERQTKPIPSTVEGVREALGDGFVLDFADKLEEHLGVDVIRVQHLSTAYSFTLGGRMAVMLPATLNWWRSNFSLAHEVAHLALGHDDVGTESEIDAREFAANQFASELLMPESTIRALNWDTITCADVGQFLWGQGIGTQALGHRLNGLGIGTTADVAEMLTRRMPGALRPWQQQLTLPRANSGNLFADIFYDPIDERMQKASQRRFPLTLLAAHRQRIEDTGLNPATLAWMLQSPVEDLAEGEQPAGTVDDLLAAFGN